MLLDLIKEENSKNAALRTEIERKSFTRAAQLAASLNLNNDELEKLRYQALYQMAAHYRNAHGVKILAQQYGYSKQEVKQILMRYANQMREKKNIKTIERGQTFGPLEFNNPFDLFNTQNMWCCR